MGRARIKFGTSGWRAIMCEDFTFDNVGVVTRAIAEMLAGSGHAGSTLLVGYDNRFMGARFAALAASVAAAYGLKAKVTPRSVPTPVISFDIIRHNRAGAINFTASHNPPEYNGLKFSPDWGGPALPETTVEVEARANALMEAGEYEKLDFDAALKSGAVSYHDPMPDYLARIEELVDLDAIRAAKLKVGFDPLYGTSVGYLDTMLTKAGVDLTTIHSNPDPTFGGRPPDPAEEHIPELISMVRDDSSFHLGLAADGDADRYGIVDRCGRFLEPNYFLALLFDYLVRERGFPGGAGRSVATSNLLDAVARDLGREVYETPVGFKFIGDLIRSDRIAVGGEESAGLTIKGHVPEKDGILACLLAAEMVARRSKPLFAQLEELYARVGTFVTRRENFRVAADREAVIVERLASPPSSIAGCEVCGVVRVDGLKLLLSDCSWLLVRKSGTEPVVRLYCEANSQARLGEVLSAGRAWLLG